MNDLTSEGQGSNSTIINRGDSVLAATKMESICGVGPSAQKMGGNASSNARIAARLLILQNGDHPTQRCPSNQSFGITGKCIIPFPKLLNATTIMVENLKSITFIHTDQSHTDFNTYNNYFTTCIKSQTTCI